MITRKDIEFPVEGGIYLRDWLFVPDENQEKSPSISMAPRRRGALGSSKASRSGMPC